MEWTIMLKRFGEALGIDDLTADEDGGCSLLFDGEHEVFFACDKEDHSVLMYSRIGSAARFNKDDCLMLLKASLLGAQTGGAALSIDEQTDAAVLWKRFDDTISEDVLKVVLEGFLAQVIDWKQKLARQGSRQSPSAQDSTPANADALNFIGNFA